MNQPKKIFVFFLKKTSSKSSFSGVKLKSISSVNQLRVTEFFSRVVAI
jgi:hypothetical protein